MIKMVVFSLSRDLRVLAGDFKRLGPLKENLIEVGCIGEPAFLIKPSLNDGLRTLPEGRRVEGLVEQLLVFVPRKLSFLPSGMFFVPLLRTEDRRHDAKPRLECPPTHGKNKKQEP